MLRGTACCFRADLRHTTALVMRGERWVWVLFYGPAEAAAEVPAGAVGERTAGTVVALAETAAVVGSRRRRHVAEEVAPPHPHHFFSGAPPHPHTAPPGDPDGDLSPPRRIRK